MDDSIANVFYTKWIYSAWSIASFDLVAAGRVVGGDEAAHAE